MSLLCIDIGGLSCYNPVMKTSHIQLRLSPEQKEAIRVAATRANLDMSQWVLNKIFPRPRARLLAIMWQLKSMQDKVERHYVLNDLNAFLVSLTKDDLLSAVSEDPSVSLNETMGNYVAAMIEQICVAHNAQAPKWLAERDGLRDPFFGSDLVSLRLYLLSVSPPPFRKRNIFIDSTVGDLV